MKIVITSPLKVRKITKIFHYLKDLSTDININCSSDGLYAQGMDSAHVSLFEINLQQSWFDEYECEKDDIIGINCELFYKVISCIDDNFFHSLIILESFCYEPFWAHMDHLYPFYSLNLHLVVL